MEQPSPTMAGRPRRRWSKDIPPDLSEVLKNYSEAVDLFITQFDTSDLQLREQGAEFHRAAVLLERMHKRTDRRRKYGIGALLAGMGVALLCTLIGMLDIPFPGGLTLGVTLAGFGCAVIVSANGAKMLQHSETGGKMKVRGQESMKVTEPLKSSLEEIKEMCKKLEDKKTEDQVDKSLSAIEELQELLQLVTKRSDDMKLLFFLNVLRFVIAVEILSLLKRLFQLSAAPTEDEKLRQIIIQVADQCQKTMDQLDSTKNELQKTKTSAD